ncbi:MAG: Uma2 family endonuclease [Planctomycetaceae bacterium]|nr:Uma2 family endonuclease [Planctomycetaceae bacterium]
MSLASQPNLSPQEYLALERTATRKHEYYRGGVFAMAGASPNHNRTVRNVLTQLDGQLRDGSCEVFPSDLRLYCPAGLMTYPDVQVICGPAQYYDGASDTVTNPRLIVEVLSKSTERYDRGQKFEFYRSIPTLEEYVLISYREPRIERFIRQEQGWLMLEASGLDAAMELSAIGATLELNEVFRGVDFPPPPPAIVRIDDEAPE